MNRRGFLIGMLAAPVVIRTPGLLMPVREVPSSLKIAAYERYAFEAMDPRGLFLPPPSSSAMRILKLREQMWATVYEYFGETYAEL